MELENAITTIAPIIQVIARCKNQGEILSIRPIKASFIH